MINTNTFTKISSIVILFICTLSSCKNNTTLQQDSDLGSENPDARTVLDAHSFSNPSDIAIDHMHLDLSVYFATKVLIGSVRLDLNRKTKAEVLHLDSRQLNIDKIFLDDGSEAKYLLSEDVEYFGQDLAINLQKKTKSITIFYKTSHKCISFTVVKARTNCWR